MDNTRIITYIKDRVLADALYEDGRMMELSLISKEQESILGNIYIGKVKNIVKNIHEMDVYEVIEVVKRLSAYKTDINDIIDMMMVWYRDVLILKVTKDANAIVYKDEYRFLMDQAKRSSYEGLNDIIQSLEKAKARLAANVNFEVAMEMMLLVMKEN